MPKLRAFFNYSLWWLFSIKNYLSVVFCNFKYTFVRCVKGYKELTTFSKRFILFLSLIAIIEITAIYFLSITDIRDRTVWTRMWSDISLDIYYSTGSYWLFYINHLISVAIYVHIFTILIFVILLYIKYKYISYRLLHSYNEPSFFIHGVRVFKQTCLKFYDLNILRKLIVIIFICIFMLVTYFLLYVVILYSLDDQESCVYNSYWYALVAYSDGDYLNFIKYAILKYLIEHQRFSIFLLGFIDSLIIFIIKLIINASGKDFWHEVKNYTFAKIKAVFYNYIMRFLGVQLCLCIISVVPIESIKSALIFLVFVYYSFVDLFGGANCMMPANPKGSGGSKKLIEKLAEVEGQVKGRPKGPKPPTIPTINTPSFCDWIKAQHPAPEFASTQAIKNGGAMIYEVDGKVQRVECKPKHSVDSLPISADYNKGESINKYNDKVFTCSNFVPGQLKSHRTILLESDIARENSQYPSPRKK